MLKSSYVQSLTLTTKLNQSIQYSQVHTKSIGKSICYTHIFFSTGKGTHLLSTQTCSMFTVTEIRCEC